MAGGRRDAARHLARACPSRRRRAADADAAAGGSLRCRLPTTRSRSRSRSTSGGATSAAGRRSTPSTWRSSRTTCASRSRCCPTPGLADRRGVPRRGEADGRPRRALARVRARALRAPLEAARRVGVRRRRASGDGGPQRRNRRVRTRRGRGGGGQGARALRPRPRRRPGLLRPQREPLRPAPADRLLRVEATARTRARSAGWRRHSSRPRSSRTSIPFEDEGSTEALTALHLPIALWLVVGIAYAGAPLEPGRRPDGLRPLLGRVLHLLRADRARRRRPHRIHRGDVQRDRHRPRDVHLGMAAAVRRRRGGARRLPGWSRPSRA